MSRGDQQAFPAVAVNATNGDVLGNKGMTLREYYAGLAMQSLAAEYQSCEATCAMLAVRHADALLNALAGRNDAG